MWRIWRYLILLQFIFIIESSAQLRVGPVAGAGASKVFFFDASNNDIFKTTPSLQMDGGVMASMAIHKNFVLNAELLYSYRSKHVRGLADKQYKLDSDMRYLELPIFYVLEF